jgi:hypothetical protein
MEEAVPIGKKTRISIADLTAEVDPAHHEVIGSADGNSGLAMEIGERAVRFMKLYSHTYT